MNDVLLIGLLGVIGYLYIVLKTTQSRLASTNRSLLDSKDASQNKSDDDKVDLAKKLLSLALDRYKHGGKDK